MLCTLIVLIGLGRVLHLDIRAGQPQNQPQS